MIALQLAIAALNDKQRFNSPGVISLLKTVDSRAIDDSTESVRDQLSKIVSTHTDTSKGDMASKVIDYLDETDFDEYAEYLSTLSEDGVDVITCLDEQYPENLKQIASPPLCIYVDGEVSSIHSGISIVGTRSATDHRISVAGDIARMVTQQLEETVISGLANGIDEAAHQGAIESGGKTVAALPSHIAQIKPASNRELGRKISGNGALLSEISTSVGFHKGRYLERNRITSGLSDAVVVVASKDSGGTIKQAELATEQNKPRFVYSAPTSDGQTPDRLTEEMGFTKFESTEELMRLLTDIDTASVDQNGNKTLDNF